MTLPKLLCIGALILAVASAASTASAEVPGTVVSEKAYACLVSEGQRAINFCTNALNQERPWGYMRAMLLLHRGHAYLQADQQDRANEDFRGATQFKPAGTDGYLVRARAYRLLDELEPAIRDYDAAIRIDSENYVAFYDRGQLRHRSKDYQGALQDFDRALKLKPRTPYILSSRCWTRALSGQQLELALADCSAALALEADDADTLDSRGFLYVRLGEYAKAIADFDAVLAKNPKFHSSLYLRGVAKVRSGDFPGGDADVAAAMAIDPTIGERYAGYGVQL